MGKLSISKGNSKMGSIYSVSLPSGTTCRPCDCRRKCYARRLERLRPSVLEAYSKNLMVLQTDPKTYWREVEAAIMLSRFFRFHVSGDIPDMDYLSNLVAVTKRQPHCEILCFTKKYELVNEYLVHCQLLGSAELLPQNLHLIFSAWPGLDMINPFDLPEAHVRFRNGSTTAADNAIQCNGNCTNCAITDSGCWVLKPGQQIVFDEH